MIQVEIYNNFSSIKDLSTFDRKLPIHISKALYEKLSYMNPQAEWSPKYKQGLWDGRISIYNKRTQCFPTGLCSRVRDLFKELSLEFEFVDKRNKPEKNYPIECDFGGKELRFYQNDAANLALKCQRGMLSLATGAGKTTTFKCLTGEITADSGLIKIGDYDISSRQGARDSYRLIGYCP